MSNLFEYIVSDGADHDYDSSPTAVRSIKPYISVHSVVVTDHDEHEVKQTHMWGLRTGMAKEIITTNRHYEMELLPFRGHWKDYWRQAKEAVANGRGRY